MIKPMIYRVGDGPWLLKVQAPTYSYDVPISDEMMHAIMAMMNEAAKEGRCQQS